MPSEKILIVEDEEIITLFISNVLKSNGYFVATTKTGKDALDEIKKTHYNLVLLDIGLPDMTGLEILKRIRETNDNLIVIMITGRPRLETSIDSVNYGADGYLVKPIRSKDIIDIVEVKLKQRFNRWVNSRFI